MDLASFLIGISSGAMMLLGGGDLAPLTLPVPSGSVLREERSPLPDLAQRQTLLTFGLHVTPDPATNPIDPPERFSGFHAATDFEILESEADADVPVSAIADGDVLFSGEVEGYGGVIVQSAVLDGQDVTILYGHLLLSSLVPEGTGIHAGDRLAVLAPAYSRDSGWTRKHLHLGIHKGPGIELLGYVQSASALDAFIDPMTALGGS